MNIHLLRCMFVESRALPLTPSARALATGGDVVRLSSVGSHHCTWEEHSRFRSVIYVTS